MSIKESAPLSLTHGTCYSEKRNIWIFPFLSDTNRKVIDQYSEKTPRRLSL